MTAQSKGNGAEQIKVKKRPDCYVHKYVNLTETRAAAGWGRRGRSKGR